MPVTRRTTSALVRAFIRGIVALMALSIVYAEWGKVGFVAAAFFGLKAAVLAIVVEAVIRIGRRAVGMRKYRSFADDSANGAKTTPLLPLLVAPGMEGMRQERDVP